MFKSTTYTVPTDDMDAADLSVLSGDFDAAKFYLRRYVDDLRELAMFATEAALCADDVSITINGETYGFVRGVERFLLIKGDGECEIVSCEAQLEQRLYRSGEVSATVRG